MKATELLKRQHREILALFAALGRTEDPAARRRLLDEITDALEAHAELEEEIFYPALRGSARPGEQRVLEALEQHHVVGLVLAETPDLDPEAESFVAKTTVLRTLVERHIAHEESTLFALAGRLDADAARNLGRRLEAECLTPP